MRRNLCFFFYLLIAPIILGCSAKQPNISGELNDSFQKMLAIEDVNNSFRIYIVSNDVENLKYGSDIKIAFRNTSGEKIFFPVGYGVKLYIIRNSKWLEIQNQNEYYGEGSLLQTKNQEDSGGRLVTGVRPNLPPEITPLGQEILRIVVIGEIQSIGENMADQTAAYIDVFINPQ